MGCARKVNIGGTIYHSQRNAAKALEVGDSIIQQRLNSDMWPHYIRLPKTTPLNKICTKCGTDKVIDEFYIKNGSYQSWCKECAKDVGKKWKAANLEKYKRHHKIAVNKWRKNNKEKE